MSKVAGVAGVGRVLQLPSCLPACLPAGVHIYTYVWKPGIAMAVQRKQLKTSSWSGVEWSGEQRTGGE